MVDRRWDYILGSDIVFNEELFEPLISSLLDLTQNVPGKVVSFVIIPLLKATSRELRLLPAFTICMHCDLCTLFAKPTDSPIPAPHPDLKSRRSKVFQRRWEDTGFAHVQGEGAVRKARMPLAKFLFRAWKAL